MAKKDAIVNYCGYSKNQRAFHLEYLEEKELHSFSVQKIRDKFY